MDNVTPFITPVGTLEFQPPCGMLSRSHIFSSSASPADAEAFISSFPRSSVQPVATSCQSISSTHIPPYPLRRNDCVTTGACNKAWSTLGLPKEGVWTRLKDRRYVVDGGLNIDAPLLQACVGDPSSAFSSSAPAAA